MKGSLAQAPGYVTDVLKIAAEKPFVPEQTVFGEYTFVSWVRNGLAAALEPPSGDQIRAVVRVSVSVQDENGTRANVPPRTLTLRGPGDVTGFDAGQIIRRFPIGGTRDAEESQLAHIEFDRPELPWLFSPLAPSGDQLRPWIALVVCDAAVSQIVPGPPGFPQQLQTRLGQLQPLDDAWAWAHAQILGPSQGTPSIRDRLSDGYGPTNLSRILCPRRLSPQTNYIACLVPTFDCGVKAASGLGGGTLAPAWSPGDPESELTLPVFDSWEFATAPGGDFEQLATRLHGVAAPWNVGRRLIDMRNPGGGLDPLPAGTAGAVQVLRCALVSPTPVPADQPPETSSWDLPTRDKLRAEVDWHNAADDELPRVGARMYAQFQRGANAIGAIQPGVDSDWFPQLNTSPVHRVVAGLGTRVVQRDQEELMQAAWAQVGEVRKANEMLVRIQFGRYVGESLHRNHFSRLPLGELAQVLRGAQDKVRVPDMAVTLHGAVRRSAMAPAALTCAFRRATRLRGPLAGLPGSSAIRKMVAIGSTFRDFRRLYAEPEGTRTLSRAAIESFSPALIARKLDVSEAAARGELERRLARRPQGLTIAQRLARPVALWGVREGRIDLGKQAAAHIAERVALALPEKLANDAARAAAVAPLLVGIGNGSVAEISAHANTALDRLHQRLPYSPIPSAAGLPIHLDRSRLGQLHLARGQLFRTGQVEPARGELFRAAPPSRLRFETEVSRQITSTILRSQAIDFREAALALSMLVLGDGVAALPRTPERPALMLSREMLLASFAPAATVAPYAASRIGKLPAWLAPDWFADRIAPIMAAPRFDRSMFEALDAYDRDWFIPGLGAIPYSDFVTVLETNPVFTEAFLVGLSDEMGRELLWRGYPTDQRGTYFYRFWQRNTDELTTQIHRFSNTPLGTHVVGGANPRLVLIVRGEIVRRHADVLCVAMRAGGKDAEGRPIFIDPTSDPTSVAPILFHHFVAPDFLLVGFELASTQVRNEPWWFLIVENPSAPRFGLDLPDANDLPAANGVARNELDWNDLGALVNGRFLSANARTLTITDAASNPKTATWPGNAATVARTLLQNPVRAAFDAHKLIAPALTK